MAGRRSGGLAAAAGPRYLARRSGRRVRPTSGHEAHSSAANACSSPNSSPRGRLRELSRSTPTSALLFSFRGRAGHAGVVKMARCASPWPSVFPRRGRRPRGLVQWECQPGFLSTAAADASVFLPEGRLNKSGGVGVDSQASLVDAKDGNVPPRGGGKLPGSPWRRVYASWQRSDEMRLSQNCDEVTLVGVRVEPGR